MKKSNEVEIKMGPYAFTIWHGDTLLLRVPKWVLRPNWKNDGFRDMRGLKKLERLANKQIRSEARHGK